MQKKDVDRRALMAGLGGAVAGSLLVRNAVAGSLNPPGPPAPSMLAISQLSTKVATTDVGCAKAPRPLESLPGSSTAMYVISEEGSYYQVGNIHGVPGMNIVEVQTSHADICGDGFHIFVAPGGATGVAGCGVVCTGQNVTFSDMSIIGGRIGFDFSQAARFILWDCVSVGALQAGFSLGNEGNFYDCEAHTCQQGVGVLMSGIRSLVEEGAVYSCGTGYACNGSGNIIFNNFATNCGVPFAIGPGNSYGPIVNVAGAGDMSLVPNGNNPWANFAY